MRDIIIARYKAFHSRPTTCRRYCTYIEGSLCEISSFKNTVSEVTIGEVAATQSGTLEVDVPQVKVRKIHPLHVDALSGWVR